MIPKYRKSVLGGGVRLVTEQLSSASSVALGFWAAVGSRDESPEENGLAHLLEHMVFKGTARRDKLVIAREIDRQGGQANAYTSKEYTCFHTRVRPEHLEPAVDLLVDIFQNSLYDEDELELEKQVISQEISMVEDEPEELVHDLASSAFWPGHPLGRPVAGTQGSVAALTRRDIENWISRHYVGPRLVISAAGAVEHGRLADLLTERLTVRAELEGRCLTRPTPRPTLMVKRRRLEQAHLVLSGLMPEICNARRHAAAVLNLALGGNMSSRLFQEIRERRGLAYSVYSTYTAYGDVGLMEIYSAAGPDKIAEIRQLILMELERLRCTPLGELELAEAVAGLKTGLILAGEFMENRMSRLAKNEIVFGRHIDLAETCQSLDLVKAEDVQALALEFLGENRLATCVLGPVKKQFFSDGTQANL